jgi:hypothetical protein
MTNGYRVHVARLIPSGGVILETFRDDDEITVISVDRPPATLAAFDAKIRAIAGDTFPRLPRHTHVVIDSEGLGKALWDSLKVERYPGWKLYEKRGRERQELPDALRVAQFQQRIHIVKGEHGDATRRALLGFKVEVGEDGVVGGELVVALCLAVVGKVPRPPRAY